MPTFAVFPDYVHTTPLVGQRPKGASDLAACLNAALVGNTLVLGELVDGTKPVLTVPFVAASDARNKAASKIVQGVVNAESRVAAMLESSAEMQRLAQYDLRSPNFFPSLAVVLNMVAVALQVEIENTELGRTTVNLPITAPDYKGDSILM